MVNVMLNSVKIKSLSMVNMIAKQGEMKLSTNFSFNVKYAADNKIAVAELTEKVSLPDAGEFHIYLTVEGFFKLEGIEDEEDKKDAHLMCYDLLFPHVAQQIMVLGMNSGMPGLAIKKIPMKRESVQFSKKEQPVMN